ncbi:MULTISPECIES: LysR family transcriptional regulator [Streptosporangium]|uniref:DNA-binding transcriptional LysR family regulator n=1 Tax=Streptosporangium brasiliense TaxID=47480 RepID=A0ABT9RFI1_9ACTN|nr:LysR family transcriptional regulator [Streptosporangium brasiliense]MDP9867100.1 DNA-binding transcriptional LysR family regulator [Streptosporangium brasiliense]
MATLRQLEYLITVVDAGSFTHAAELLHVTQPALSHQIRALEKSVGGTLLERLPRSVRPTPMGRAMLPYARAALADADRARTAARQAGGLEAAELHVATLYSITLGVLPAVLRAWRRQYPSNQVRLFEHRHADELAAAMAAGQADLAIGPPPAHWDGPIREIGIEEFVVVVAADDPLAATGQAHLDLVALADCAWVHYAPGNGLAEVLDQACAAAGFQPRAAIRTEQSAAAPLLAAAGLGPALVPANSVPAGFDGRLLRPRPAIRRPLAAYTRTRPDALTTAFTRTVTEHACVFPEHVQALLEADV